MMSKKYYFGLLLLLFVFCCFQTNFAQINLEDADSLFDPNSLKPAERQLTGKVIRVSDGDTIAILDEYKSTYKIRFEGIDAPESKQDFGQKSKKNLSDLIYGKTVVVSTSKVDKYGRFVGKVTLDGKDINLEQLKGGFAWHFKRYSDEQKEADRIVYAKTESEAKAAKLGLWADAAPTPPWDWRRGVNNAALDGVPVGSIIGNKNSMIYHTPGCSTYTKVSKDNRVIFKTAEEAEKAGYRISGACGDGKKRTEESKPVTPTTKSSSTVNSSTSTSKPKTDRVYQKGSRGGCYYLSDSGKKVYVDRSLCN